MNTYQQQLDLVSRGLAVKKTDGIFDTFKYSRKVMYDYLWDAEPLAMECRGHIYDNSNGNLVQAAPRKSFNYLENGHWKDVSLDQKVILYKKINGFMACATIYENQFVVSTTGSTTSEYAQWAKQEILKKYNINFFNEVESALFEIVVPQDPHIVEEKEGVHLLGFRMKSDGFFFPVADSVKAKEMTLDDALHLRLTDKGEGYMIYKIKENGYIDTSNCCKLKSQYYVFKKKLMRQTKTNTELMYNSTSKFINSFPKEWHPVIDHVIRYIDKENWMQLKDQERRLIIEAVYQ